MRSIHTGTCNDGVGKGCSGGVIVVNDPNSQQKIGENVLVGNFALFGATGGQLYVAGQAGDRFGVRNSGAVAVVEGVGDFCCEYMTNGTVINLGSYGKGFGNGMSGGAAFQYDPEQQLAERCSRDSVEVFAITEDTRLANAYEHALKLHLQAHTEQTGSPLAAQLLSNWAESRQHFVYVVPRSLLQYHRSEPIFNAMSRKAMLEELSSAHALMHCRRLQQGYAEAGDNRVGMFEGQVPDYGDCDSDLICQFVVAAGILRRALELAEKSGKADTDLVSRRLIELEDKKLLDLVAKDIQGIFADYCDQALSVLLADKRLSDYKNSFRLREVWDIQALSTTAWIIECDTVNRELLKEYTPLSQAMATYYAATITEALRQQVA